jgi:hypothetical protein
LAPLGAGGGGNVEAGAAAGDGCGAGHESVVAVVVDYPHKIPHRSTKVKYQVIQNPK